MKKSELGFTLIELLIVVAIIGILAAIAIPNLLTAIQRSKQKRTMADVRAIAVSWEARATDMSTFGAAGATWTFPTSAAPTQTDMILLLTPTYIKSMPTSDGWNQPYTFGLDQAVGAASSAQAYAIRSAARDGTYESETYPIGKGTQNFDCDIVFSNGSFIQWPEGVQTQ